VPASAVEITDGFVPVNVSLIAKPSLLFWMYDGWDQPTT
jgi:hypothetical protein